MMSVKLFIRLSDWLHVVPPRIRCSPNARTMRALCFSAYTIMGACQGSTPLGGGAIGLLERGGRLPAASKTLALSRRARLNAKPAVAVRPTAPPFILPDSGLKRRAVVERLDHSPGDELDFLNFLSQLEPLERDLTLRDGVNQVARDLDIPGSCDSMP